MQDEIQMSEEQEALLADAPSPPRPGRYTSLAERKKRALYMKEWRQSKRDEAGHTQQAREEHEKFMRESYGLFEDENQRLYDSVEGLLSSCRRFAQILRATGLDVPDVLPGESLRSFGTRVYEAWRLRSFARIIYTGYDFRLNCGCLGEWPVRVRKAWLP